VSWESAQRFCELLSALYGERQAGRIYRLPTEAEWEYACRAGTSTAFWWGNSASSNQANFDGAMPYGDAPRGPSLSHTTRVGRYPANAFGLFDTHGNVWEWCEDFYEPAYYTRSQPVDPLGPPEGNRKCTRGGSWSNAGVDCRSACRDYWYGISYARNNIGFRVAMTISR
jgi:formylglycine-generating enzyme required for sulfatase activity